MKKFVLPLFLGLSACVNTPKPEPRVQQVYCITPQQYAKLKDAEPPKIGDNLSPNAQDAFKQVSGQDVLLRLYADGLLKVLADCTTQPLLNDASLDPAQPYRYRTSTSETPLQLSRTDQHGDTVVDVKSETGSGQH